ncbi:MAG TPA: hypothetical protein VKM72_11325 [Thermoanaerobaculia bacterium]|nr:hypothetical protein [Thermoanaerobaculia bacterium]
MKKVVVSLALFAMYSIPAFAGSATVKSTSDKGAYEITVTTTPDAQKADVFICTVVMKNGATNEIISAPALVFRAGEAAQIESKGDSDSFRLSLSSDSGKNEAKAVCEYSVHGDVVFAPTLVFELR